MRSRVRGLSVFRFLFRHLSWYALMGNTRGEPDADPDRLPSFMGSGRFFREGLIPGRRRVPCFRLFALVWSRGDGSAPAYRRGGHVKQRMAKVRVDFL